MALEPLFPVEPQFSHRRYLLLKMHAALRVGDGALAAVWKAYLLEIDGHELPALFPFRAVLIAAGYTTREDLDGATISELVRTVRLGQFDAEAVINAFKALPAIEE